VFFFETIVSELVLIFNYLQYKTIPISGTIIPETRLKKTIF